MQKNNFSTMGSIIPDVLNTWDEQLFLSFDIDWADDEVLAETIDLVEKADVAGTWFVTHETPLLQRLRANPKFELGIHPNFNFLLNGDPRNGATAEEVIDRLLEFVPEAKSVRSHSLTQSSVLTHLYASKGLTHESNQLIPDYSSIRLKPWSHPCGMHLIPYLWSDYLTFTQKKASKIEDVMRLDGLKVFMFHPIHVFLNTEKLSRYESTRNIQRDPGQLRKYKNSEKGTRTALESLIFQ